MLARIAVATGSAFVDLSHVLRPSHDAARDFCHPDAPVLDALGSELAEAVGRLRAT